MLKKASYHLSAITQDRIDTTMASGLPGPADVVLIFLPCFAVVVIGAWLGFRYYGKKQIQKRTPNQVYQVGHDDHSIQSQSSFQSPQAVGVPMPTITAPSIALPPPAVVPQH